MQQCTRVYSEGLWTVRISNQSLMISNATKWPCSASVTSPVSPHRQYTSIAMTHARTAAGRFAVPAAVARAWGKTSRSSSSRTPVRRDNDVGPLQNRLQPHNGDLWDRYLSSDRLICWWKRPRMRTHKGPRAPPGPNHTVINHCIHDYWSKSVPLLLFICILLRQKCALNDGGNAIQKNKIL